MKNILKNFFFATVPTLLVLFILLELVFRFIIPAAESPWGLYDQEYNVLKFDQSFQKDGYYTLGNLGQEAYFWSINKAGWNSPFEYETAKKEGTTRIAVIGDSYIESLMVNNSDHYPTVLKNKLGDKHEVYAFGISGAPLSQYLQMSRYVNQQFDPDILLVNVVYNDFSMSIDRYGERYYYLRINIDDTSNIKEIKPVPRVERKFRSLKKSAFLRYFVNNKKGLRNFLKRKKPDGTEILAGNTGYPPQFKLNSLHYGPADKEILAPIWSEVETVTDYLVGKFMAENKNTRRVIFIMDGPRYNIYNDNIHENQIVKVEEILKAACEKHHAEYLPLTPLFIENYEKNGKRFDNELDMHWNDYGHQLIADHIINYLNSDPEPSVNERPQATNNPSTN